MKEEKLEKYEVEEEKMEDVSGGIECDEVYNPAPVATCPKCGTTPAFVTGYYKTSQISFVTKRFEKNLCKSCGLKEARNSYPDMELKEVYFDMAMVPPGTDLSY